ncbi:hydantoinase B/oxoprolinase family protein [Rhodococcus sp. T2V]|uniref:hydantoinase B/oxoprolinase family protein n=1 Tax=Rhodococcus sp. T2V TaxID=3034164 RepID=UPI0023E0D34C|nr:hydantoinase B/oxoprolinase family protein [Rhodococcus sp. T2V]MDF3305294.1 hydantoinase B/oxoprolinase family protein [Rhodococcus sp. T2V]
MTDTLPSRESNVVWDGVARGYIPADPPRVDPAVKLHRSVVDQIDPVTYEVIRYSLMNANLEHADLIQRLSLSPIVMTARDFQTSVLTEIGEVVNLGAGVQYFSNQNSLTVKFILEHRAAHGIRKGDIFLANDPYIGSSHQSDVTLAAPVMVGDEIFCWLSNSMHHQDVGGPTPGSQCVEAIDSWQEPMVWPPVTLVEHGRLRSDIEELFVRQSRYPGLSRMDLRAGMGALAATRTKLTSLIDKYGADVVKGVMHRVLDAGEAVFVERLADIPDGRWSHRGAIEGAVPGDRSTYVYQVNITKTGDQLIVDNEGTDPQAGGINLSFAGFSGCVLSSLTQQMLPEMAGAYGGAYRRVEFRPIPGLLNCADHPAAVSSSGVFTSEAMMNVAASAVCKMLASGSDETRNLTLGAPTPNLASLIGAGLDESGNQFMLIDANGLMGSLAGRASRDGVDSGGHWWIPDATAANSEDLEAQTPFLVLSRELLPVGLDGSGKYRAGVGFKETLMAHRVLGASLVVYQNESFPRGQGLFGGNPGSLATCRVKHGTDVLEKFKGSEVNTSIDDIAGEETVLPYKGAPQAMGPGDVVEWVSPGAAGYGDPLLRDPALVLADVRAQMLDEAVATRVYGVVISDEAVDTASTNECRLSACRERLGGHEPKELVTPPHGARRVGELVYVVDGRWWCNGADLGPLTAGYKAQAIVRETAVCEIGPEYAAADRVVADRFVLREFICGVTGYRIDTELALAAEDPIQDIQIVERAL